MDFFQQQDKARFHTKTLVCYYVIGLIAMTVALYALVVVAAFVMEDPEAGYSYARQLEANWFIDPILFLATLVGVTLIVGGASGVKMLQLSSGGGDAVAKSLGGRRLQQGTSDLREQKLLNIVEEMSLASGVRMPSVYLLDGENQINAFAAGMTPNAAAIGITRGAVEYLNRDELQGVIGHEFSHILNGDMRINLRMIGLLFGFNFLVILGWQLMRVAMYSGSGRQSSGKGKNQLGMILIAIGLVLVIFGAIGMFFSFLMQAAISRQREYLADASAVQFTRNPMGIANALKKIGCPRVGSSVQSPKAAEASHLFFSNIFRFSFGSLFATHPPLAERVRRIDPLFDGKFPSGLQPVSN